VTTGPVTERRRPRRGETSITGLMRSDVMAGRLAPGSRLVELQLADAYGSSRAAVRSAIVELEKEGLVEREANRGATVRRFSTHDAVQISEARCLLEVFAAERAATKATPLERQELREIGERMSDAVARSRPDEYHDLNRELHKRIREIGRHAVVSELIENLRNRAATVDVRLAVMPGRASESLVEHHAIIDAVVAGDAEGAGRSTRAHIESVIEALRRWQELPF
jgi:DNA-binding GntR family transcriptional regulator